MGWSLRPHLTVAAPDFQFFSRCSWCGERGRLGAGWCRSLSFVEWVRVTNLPKLCNRTSPPPPPPLQNCHGNSWIFVFRCEWVHSVFFRCVVPFGLAAVWPLGERGSCRGGASALCPGSPSALSCHSHQFTRCFTPAVCSQPPLVWPELPVQEFLKDSRQSGSSLSVNNIEQAGKLWSNSLACVVLVDYQLLTFNCKESAVCFLYILPEVNKLCACLSIEPESRHWSFSNFFPPFLHFPISTTQ